MSNDNAAMNLRVQKLKDRGVELGAPLTADIKGAVFRGYYDGVMIALPGVAEAYFVKDVESGLVIPDEPPSQPQPQRLVNSIDISNHQEDVDLWSLLDRLQTEYCIVRVPQRVEPADLARIAHEQIEIVLAKGVKLGAYFWLYRDVEIEQQVEDVVRFLAGYKQYIQANLLWPDIEPYQTNDNLPDLNQIKECVSFCFDADYFPGIYTGPWVWKLLGNPHDPVLSSLPLWSAEYNEVPTLDSAQLYGGWTACAGHQFTSNPVDQSVFDSVILEL
jgi:hypothetical protein